MGEREVRIRRGQGAIGYFDTGADSLIYRKKEICTAG